MQLRLRQICLVAADLDPVVAGLRQVFGLEICYVDAAVAEYGLVNALMPVGNQFLEVVAPTRPGTAAGRYLERRGGDGGYMVITQCDDLDRRRKRVDELGIRVANHLDYDRFQGMQLHPKDTGGAFFEIDRQADGDAGDGPWHPAGPDWQPYVRTHVVSAIVAAEVQSPDPDTLAERWSAIAEVPLVRSEAGVATLPLANADLRFVAASDGRGEGLAGVELRAEDADAALAHARALGVPQAGNVIQVAGMRFALV
ncbi:MAG: VOC family protein [Alphaproteobacteria bacterium]|nr:VOC family protein [Alphaproteobacteria bacterium]